MARTLRSSLSCAVAAAALFAAPGHSVAALLFGADGALSAVPGSPFGPGYLYGVAAVDLGGRTFVYGAELGDDLLGFEAGADGALAPLPGSPSGPLDDPTGIADRKSFAVDPKTGVLTPVDEEPIAQADVSPTAVVFVKR